MKAEIKNSYNCIITVYLYQVGGAGHMRGVRKYSSGWINFGADVDPGAIALYFVSLIKHSPVMSII